MASMLKNLGRLFGMPAEPVEPIFLPKIETKKSAVGGLFAFHHQGQPVWTPRDYSALAQEGFIKNAVAYRCVRMIAETAASVKWRVIEEGLEQTEHPLLELLAMPNPVQGGSDLMETFYAYVQVAGNGYLEVVQLEDDLRELHVLRPDRMKIVPGAQGWPEAYEYTVSGKTHRFAQTQDKGVRPIMHLALFHPTNDHYGLSPLEAAAIGIDLHNAAGAWNKAMLDNSARPSGALVFKGSDGSSNLTDEQFERLKHELETTYQGAANAGRPFLLEGGLDWKSMGLSPKDMDFIEAKHVAAREIALAFGVPPMLLGIPGDNTFNNYAEANRNFWRQTILPLVGKTAQTITRWLAPAYPKPVKLWYDIDQIEALSPERTALWERIQKADFLTVNEKRRAVGFDPVEGGDSHGD